MDSGNDVRPDDDVSQFGALDRLERRAHLVDVASEDALRRRAEQPGRRPRRRQHVSPGIEDQDGRDGAFHGFGLVHRKGLGVFPANRARLPTLTRRLLGNAKASQ